MQLTSTSDEETENELKIKTFVVRKNSKKKIRKKIEDDKGSGVGGMEKESED